MEYQNPTSTRFLNSDIISTIPQNIIENTLCLMPIRDALRTSVLSKTWRYSWRSMPKLVFTNDMVKLPSNPCCRHLKKYKLVSAIFHVLLLHNGPEILVFRCSVGRLHLESLFAQIISSLAKGNTVKQLTFYNDKRSYKLPVSFFSLQGLELVHLQDCTFDPPLTSNVFSRLKSLDFVNVEVVAQMLQRFISNCPMLEHIYLTGDQKDVEFVAGGSKFTFVDLLLCVPLIKTLGISKYYMKYLSAGGKPHKLPTTLTKMEYLFLDVYLMEQNEISSALYLIRNSPLLVEISIMVYDDDKLPVRQTPTNFLDLEGHPDLKLDHLETLVVEFFGNLTLEMEFVKLIMAKSPVLKKVRIELNDSVSNAEELKMLRDLVLLPFPRASPSAKLTIVRL